MTGDEFMQNSNYNNQIYFGKRPQKVAVPTIATPVSMDSNIYIFPQNLAGALELIQQAVAGETEDKLFYTYLIENAPTNEDKQIIGSIRDNEITHFSLFKQIYKDLTGKDVVPKDEEKFIPPKTYCDGLKRALLGEQNAVMKYRKILFAMQSRVHINMLTEIITDEIRHGILYNYLYSKNGCKA